MKGRLKRHNAQFRKKIVYHTKRRRLQTKTNGRLTGYKRPGSASSLYGAARVAYQGVQAVRRNFSQARLKRQRTSPTVNAMQELTKSRKKVNMGKYNMSRVVNSIVNHRVERFQLLSNFDTNVGASFLSNMGIVDGQVYSPMYFIDCGSLTQPVMGTGPPVLYRAGWASTAAGADLIFPAINGQNPNGGNTGVDAWQIETTDKATASSFDSMILNWINLRINLYGQRKRTTKFLITVFQVNDEEVDPVTGLNSNVDKKALFQYLERPFIFSNLQQDQKRKKTGIRVIKEFTYNVAPMTTIDLNTTTGNIHEANVNIKINKRMDYIYNVDGNMLPHAQIDGLDYTVSSATAATGLHINPRPKQNVYMCIRAFAPVRVVAGEEQADDCPSFDIIVRRSVSLPPHN